MFTFDSVKLRLDLQLPSFCEFNYMIFQAYDFKKLYEDTCTGLLQIGVSINLGNIVNGVEFIRRTKLKKEA